MRAVETYHFNWFSYKQNVLNNKKIIHAFWSTYRETRSNFVTQCPCWFALSILNCFFLLFPDYIQSSTETFLLCTFCVLSIDGVILSFFCWNENLLCEFFLFEFFLLTFEYFSGHPSKYWPRRSMLNLETRLPTTYCMLLNLLYLFIVLIPNRC